MEADVSSGQGRAPIWCFRPAEFAVFSVMTLLVAIAWIIMRQATYGYSLGAVAAMMIGAFARSRNLRGGIYLTAASIIGVIL